jgi:hypothetical protein
VGQEPQRRFEFGVGPRDPLEAGLVIAEIAGQQRVAEPGAGHVHHREEAVHPDGRWTVGQSREPLGRPDVRETRVEADPGGGRESAVGLRERWRRVRREPEPGDAASDDVLRRRGRRPDRDVGVPAHQVERLVRDRDLQLDLRMLFAERRQDRRQHGREQRVGRRDTHEARRPEIAPPQPVLDEQQVVFGAPRERVQFVARGRGLVAVAQALEEPHAEIALQLLQPPEDGRLVHAERLGRLAHRPAARECGDELEIAGFEHRGSDRTRMRVCIRASGVLDLACAVRVGASLESGLAFPHPGRIP